jgi:hypothetical protein
VLTLFCHDIYVVACRFLPPDYSDGIEAPRLSLTGKKQLDNFKNCVNKVHLSQNNGVLKLDYHDNLKGNTATDLFLQSMNKHILHGLFAIS